MVYEIDGKYYIMANHKFYEVKIEKNGSNYDVKIIEKAKPIEYKYGIVYNSVTIQEAYKSNKKVID